MIESFLTDDVLLKAQESVYRATQDAREDEAEYTDLVSKAALRCRREFRMVEFVNYFVQDIKTSARDAITQTFRQMRESYNLSIALGRETAVSQGIFQRYLNDETKETRSTEKDPTAPQSKRLAKGAHKPTLLVNPTQE